MSEAKFVISKGKVLEQYNKVERYCDIVAYSSKTNQDVTKILENNTKCLFSVHFSNELVHVKDKSRVVFLSQGWTEEEIKELIKQGIKYFIVDNEKDLDILIDFLQKNDASINLMLRIRLKENTLRTERYFVFGMPSEVINKKIKEIRENKNLKGKIKSLGIHYHRKTQNMSEWNLQYEFENMIREDVSKKIDFVNIGGGLPSDYANTNVDVINSIFEKISKFRSWLNNQGIKLIIEPGRFIAAPAGKLITSIVRIYDNNIIVDASVYNTDMDAIIVPVKLLVEGELSKQESDAMPYVIKGITPCSMDLFRYRCYLKEPKEGDKLIFLNAGAYNFTSDFCDLKKLKTEVID